MKVAVAGVDFSFFLINKTEFWIVGVVGRGQRRAKKYPTRKAHICRKLVLLTS
jgi:hypothetical protein